MSDDDDAADFWARRQEIVLSERVELFYFIFLGVASALEIVVNKPKWGLKFDWVVYIKFGKIALFCWLLIYDLNRKTILISCLRIFHS